MCVATFLPPAAVQEKRALAVANFTCPGASQSPLLPNKVGRVSFCRVSLLSNTTFRLGEFPVLTFLFPKQSHSLIAMATAGTDADLSCHLIRRNKEVGIL